jgi:phosphopantetheinyl transferase (holo-ACP synthase)
MPLRPFPFPISIGTDIASINRVQKIIEQGHDNFRRYIRRFLTEREQRLILRQHGDADLSDPMTVRRISQHLAGRCVRDGVEVSTSCVGWIY